MSARGQTTEQGAVARSLRPVLISALVGAAVCMVCLALLAAVVATRNIPHAAIDPMALTAISAGAFAGGFSCGKILRSRGLLYGAICGAVLTFVVLTGGMAVSEAGLGIPALFRAVFILLSSMLGGVLGVNTKKGRRR